MLGAGTFGRTLSKSMSTSSLRRSFNAEDSILAPGAFSNSPRERNFGSARSVKKLTINRTIRENLFDPPPGQQALPAPASSSSTGILKKRVSFDSNVNGTLNGNGVGTSSPLKQVSNNVNAGAEGVSSTKPRPNGSGLGTKTNGNTSPPEMEQVPNANNQLAVVREEEVAAPEQTLPPTPEQKDKVLGEYWMRPTRKEIDNMNREQRKKVTGFTVGRGGVGSVTFDVPVDLNTVNLDEIYDGIVDLRTRRATVYADSRKKPAMGKGLNVPSTIVLENSWPRKSGKSKDAKPLNLQKHVKKLRSVGDTDFVNYDAHTGIWTFTVQHFTTYGFPEDEDETENDFGQSTLSAPPESPTPTSRTPISANHDQSFASTSQISRTESDPEDTFDFKRKKLLPGAFDDQEMYDELEVQYNDDNEDSFLDERSVGSQSDNGVEEPMDQDEVYQDGESVSIMDQEMAGSFPEAGNTAELEEDSQNGDDVFGAETPNAITRAKLRALKNAGTPLKRHFGAADDWAATLQTTVSPKKQDRAFLKSLIELHGDGPREQSQPAPMPRRVVSDGRGFATSIDLMNSLFGQSRSPVKAHKVPATAKGFEVGFPSHL